MLELNVIVNLSNIACSLFVPTNVRPCATQTDVDSCSQLPPHLLLAPEEAKKRKSRPKSQWPWPDPLVEAAAERGW